MTLQEWLYDFGACGPARRWVGDKSLQEAWATCHRGDWMRWLSVAACGNTSWTPKDHEKMLLAWRQVQVEYRMDEAYELACGSCPPTRSRAEHEGAVWFRFTSLEADFYRSIQPTPPTIEGLEE